MFTDNDTQSESFTTTDYSRNISNISAVVAYSPTVPMIKFFIGLITLSLYSIILLCLPYCTTIGYSTRMFLIMIFSLNLVFYSVLTFYAPFVAAGYIVQIQNVTALKIISTVFVTPIYALHLGQTIIAVDRFIAIRYASKHDFLFSPFITKCLISGVFLYGASFGLMSWANCCYFVYNPSNQGWSYPNDIQTRYRVYVTYVSNFGNAIFTGTLYVLVMNHLRKMKLQIADTQMRQTAFKRELTIVVLFAAPWLTNSLAGVLVVVIQQLPSNLVGSWLFVLSESTRYAYALEPILTIILLKQIRRTLKNKVFRFTAENLTETANVQFTTNV